MKFRIKTSRKTINTRSNIFFGIMLVFALVLVVRLGYIMIGKNDEYQNKALTQATTEQVLVASRGTVYDRNMNILAVSTTVERVFISPSDMPQMSVGEHIDKYVDSMTATSTEKEEERAKLKALFPDLTISVKEDVATMLSEALGVEKSFVLQEAEKTASKDRTIKRQVDAYVTEELLEQIVAKHYTAFVHTQPDTKRSYPNGAVASHVLGFTGTENTGLLGIELSYNELLSGTNGKIITAVNGVGEQMPYKYESLVEPINGTNLMLTLDLTVQKILEKHLETALADTQAEQGVWGIVMEVDTGEILGMAGVGDFDPNNPYVLDPVSQEKYDSFVGTDEEKNEYFYELIYSMWQNKLVTNTYEPGSTFKMLTAAMALEENLVTPHDRFNCPGYIRVEGYPKPINCHLHSGHGLQSFEEALWHSCNPVFVTIGQKVGTEKFYEYFKAFGYLEKTGIDLPGERMGIWFADNFNLVELSVSSFGQTFTVTPIQHIAAVSAVANGGHLVTPHLLKATVDDGGDVIENYNSESKRQIISEKTCSTVISYMKGGVENGGSSRNAYVTGYSVAAKTGTSVKTDIRTQTGETKYIASCVAFAPAEDPKIAIMVLVDEPIGTYYGGTIAAPVVSRVLYEVLPYLGVDPVYEENQDLVQYPLSSYVSLPIDEAKRAVEEDGYEYKVIGSGSSVIRQVPSQGEGLTHGSTVVLYTDEVTSGLVTVPNVVGMTSTLANRTLVDAGLNIRISGTSIDWLEGAISVSQSIPQGEVVDRGTVVEVEFRHFSNITD